MTMRFAPICLGCKHFQQVSGTTGTCAAFPKGIPDAIWLNEADHRQPMSGDQGIQFAPEEPAYATYAESLFPVAHEHRFIENRCMVCGCGLPTTDHGLGYLVKDASTEPNTGCMVAFFLPASCAQQLAIPGGCAPSDLHITLAFLGDTTEILIDKQNILATVERFAKSQHPLYIDIDALDRFPGDADEGSPIIARTFTPALFDFRAALVSTLDAAGIAVDMTYPEYRPHCTLAYIPQDAPMPDIPVPNQHPCLQFVWVAYGDERYSFPLGGDESTERAEMAETLRTLKAQVSRVLTAEY